MATVQDEIVEFKLDVVREQLLAEFPANDVKAFVNEDVLQALLLSGSSLERAYSEAEWAINLRGRSLSRVVMTDVLEVWGRRAEWVTERGQHWTKIPLRKPVASFPLLESDIVESAPSQNPGLGASHHNKGATMAAPRPVSQQLRRMSRGPLAQEVDVPQWIPHTRHRRRPLWRKALTVVGDVLFVMLVIAVILSLGYVVIVLWRKLVLI